MASKKAKLTPEGDGASPQQIKSETGNDMEPVELWLREIEDAKTRSEEWFKQSRKIISRYRDDRSGDNAIGMPKGQDERRYNVLWSAMETMKPLVYNRPPTPYMSRRHNDSDPIARDTSMLIERGLNYSIDTDELHNALLEARDDYLLTSRGVIWFKYTPYFKLRESELRTYTDEADEDELDDVDDDDIKEDDDGRKYFHKKYEEKIYEEVNVEHVAYDDFLHGAASKWKNVPWIARRVPMTRQELIKRFGKDMGSRPPLALRPKAKTSSKSRDNSDDEKSMFGKAEVWEIWDKSKRQIYWLCPQLPETFLDVKDDILDLDGFFPCPRPVYGTKTNDSLVPVPDYKLWQDIALELDDVSYRIMLLTKAVRVSGVYDKSAGDSIKRLVTHTRDNDLIPVDNWGLFAERGGLRGSIEFVDISVVMAALDKLVVMRQQLIQELYEITGLSDIVRGATDPRETATAQSTKAGFANKRLGVRQDAMSRMAREAMDIMSEIMCKHYSKETIREITSADELLINPNTRLFDQLRFETAIDLMRNCPMRRFRVKVDERNLAMVDDAQERADRNQFLQSLSQFLTAALPMVQNFPATAPLMGEMLMFGVRSFNMARSTEAAIESAILKLISQPAPPQPQEAQKAGKSPEEIAILKEKNQIAMGHLQLAEQKHNDNMQEAQADKILKSQELQIHAKRGDDEMQIRQAKILTDAAAKDKQLNIQQQQVSSQAQTEQARLVNDMNNDHHSMVMAFMHPKETKPAPKKGAA